MALSAKPHTEAAARHGRDGDFPQVRSEIEWRTMADGQSVVTAGGTAHLSLSSDELKFLLDLDGTRAISELSSCMDDDVLELFGEFSDAGLLVGTATSEKTGTTLTRAGIEFSGFGRFVASVYDNGGRLVMTRPGLLVMLVVILVGGLGLMAVGSRQLSAVAHFSGPVVILALSLSGILASVFHETAHALVIHHHGRRVGAAGMGFYWGALSFYVDATDALMLPKRVRLLQGVAGPAADALLASLLTIVGLTLSTSSPWAPLLQQMSVLLWIDVALNLCPILELDGYWAVADALDRPQLRAESYGAIRQVLRGERSAQSIRLSIFGSVSVLAGLALIGLSIWLWVHVYADLVVGTWVSGPLGKFAVAVWLLPSLIGILASAIGRIKGLLASRPRREDEQLEVERR